MKAKSAERYAQALVECGERENTRDEMSAFSSLLEKAADLSAVLFKEIFDVEEKKSVLRAVFNKIKFSETMQRFLFCLIENNRSVTFFDIQKAYEQRMNNLEKRDTAKISSATELSDTYKNKLIRQFEEKLNMKLDATYEVDANLLGGVVTKIGNKIYDGSIRTQLQQLSYHLQRGV